MEDEEEWPRILSIYEEFPLKELIIHPRLKTDQYRQGTIHTDAFALAAEKSRHSLCYNGDINSVKSLRRSDRKISGRGKAHAGSGILRKPWLTEAIRQGNSKEQEEKKGCGFFMIRFCRGTQSICSATEIPCIR